jgi:hypothetical protein
VEPGELSISVFDCAFYAPRRPEQPLRPLEGESEDLAGSIEKMHHETQQVGFLHALWSVSPVELSVANCQFTIDNYSAPRGSRTPNPQIRSLMLYPIELWVR